MSEQNKDVSYLNLLQQFKGKKNRLAKPHQQDQEINLSVGLSLGGRPYTRPSSGSRSQPHPETGFIVRNLLLKGKSYAVRYVCGKNSSGRLPARAVSLHPDVESEFKKSKETKAMNRYEAKIRSMLKKRQLEKEGGEEEGWQSVKFGKFEGKSRNWVNGSAATKDIAYFHAMEKPKYTYVLNQSSNAAWAANAYHPEPNQKVFEIGKSTYNPYANTYANGNMLTKCTWHAYEANAASMGGREIVPDSNKTPRINEKPIVTAVGPTGKILEGILFKYGTGHVTIVCLCHYHWLTPADFVRHAGWADMANPMQHIKVLVPDL